MNPVQPPPLGGQSSTSVDVLLWVGALIVAVLILGIVILIIRKRLFTRDSDAAAGLLNDLRRMHKTGELTTEEYDAARKALTSRVASRMPAPATPPRPARANPAPPAELRAKPGFDLTGAPLPAPPPPPGPYDRKPPTN